MLVVIKGAGDIATGIAWRLYQAHFPIIMTEISQPTSIRNTVAFASSVYAGSAEVEGVPARLCNTAPEALKTAENGTVAVIIDPEGKIVGQLKPEALVDAILAKRNLGTSRGDAPVVIGVGPGFTAGEDCHYVVETKRGHSLGRVITVGPAAPNSGIPGTIGGYSSERILRSPGDGIFHPIKAIGDVVVPGEITAEVDGAPLFASIGGVIRGMLHDGLHVTSGFKCGDIDPRGDVSYCFTISDKARAVGGGVLEAVMRYAGGRMP